MQCVLIVCYTYINFVDSIRKFVIKPYDTKDAHSICPQLQALLDIWCYSHLSTKEVLDIISPTLQAPTKAAGKAAEHIHAPKVLHKCDTYLPPFYIPH